MLELIGCGLQQAAEWVGYAIATGPEPFLWPCEISMPWWQIQYLDVAALAVAMLAAGAIARRCCLRYWYLRQGNGLATHAAHAKSA